MHKNVDRLSRAKSNSIFQLLYVYTNKIQSLASCLKGLGDTLHVAHKSRAGMKPRISTPGES